MFIWVFLVSLVAATEFDHFYEYGGDVTVWYNRGILPNSPNVLFSFNDIPWCQGSDVNEYPRSIGSMLSGIEPKDSGIQLKFKQDSATDVFCEKKLTKDEIKRLVKIIQLGLLAELSIDQLPVWTAVGEESEQVFVYSTFHITIHYNLDRIVQVKVLPDDPTPLLNKKSFTLRLSYSVAWIPTDEAFENRMELYSESGVFPTNIHWFSILNSSAIILSVCFVIIAVLYKALKNDLSHDESIFDLPTGWKNVESEAISAPFLNSLLSALVGIGSEVFVIIFFETCLLESGIQQREMIMPWVYGLSGLSAAYFTLNTQQELKGWIFSLLCTGGCFPCIITSLAIVFSLLGMTIHTFYYIGIAINVFLFFFVSRKSKPPQVQKLKIRGIVTKKKPWYLENTYLIAAGGILPFISIALELSFLLRSLLTYQLYIMHGFLLISFVQVSICLGCVGIVTAYLVLNTEDPSWQWPSFLSGGVLGAYILLYSAYFYTFINGSEDFLSFMVNMTGICFLIFLASGFLSFTVARFFIQRLYERLKND